MPQDPVLLEPADVPHFPDRRLDEMRPLSQHLGVVELLKKLQFDAPRIEERAHECAGHRLGVGRAALLYTSPCSVCTGRLRRARYRSCGGPRTSFAGIAVAAGWAEAFMGVSSIIGQPVRRVDGGEKVAGLTRFAAAVMVPGMLHARLVTSPHPHARVVSMDTTAARALPGVVAVLTGRDLPLAKPHASLRNKAPLALDEVFFNGHPLVAVVAETEAIGPPEHRVRVIAMPVGGGFGGKFVLLEPLAAALAVAVRRPVSVVMTRNEEFLSTTPAPQSRFEVTLGAKRDGTLTALRARVLFDAGAWAGAPLNIACLLLASYYRIPNFDVRGVEVRTHKPGSGAYRAPGAPQATFAIESAMSEMAERLGLDPLAFRLQNAVAGGDSTPTGRPWPRIGLRECLEAVRRARDESDRAASAHGTVSTNGRGSGVVRGVGVAVGGWLGGVEPASAVCRVNGDGSLSVVVGSVDLSGTNTGLAQVAAEAFGASLGQVQIVNADTESAPYAGASGGSKITYTVGAAVKAAAEDARRQLLAIAASDLEASVQDLELADGHVRVRGVPDRAVAIAQLARKATEFGGKYEPIFGRGASATTARAPGFAVHLCEVEVDRATGAVRIVRHVVAQDVGRAVNPAAIEGQIRGGVAQGVGWGLLEHMRYDEAGRLLSGTLMDYALPTATHVPPGVEGLLIEVPSENGPFGARGVGEPPVVAGGAAIANAIADATGVRFTALPITSEAIARATTADGA